MITEADLRGLELQIETMTTIAARREEQFFKCREERSVLLAALADALGLLRPVEVESVDDTGSGHLCLTVTDAFRALFRLANMDEDDAINSWIERRDRLLAKHGKTEEAKTMTTPDQIVDERQRLDFADEARRVIASTNAQTDPLAKLWAQRYVDEIDRLNGTVRPEGWQIEAMVNRFLSWKLPADFNPDGGISFKPTFNEHTAHPMRAEPTGTNLFDATQARQMIEYLLAGLSVSPAAPEGWQMVPIKLTDEMIRAVMPMYDAMIAESEWPFTINLWAALLAAAPPSPAQEQET